MIVFPTLPRNVTRFVDLLACFSVLDCPSHSAMEKLSTLWEIHTSYGDDNPVMDNALATFTSCCKGT